MGLVDYSDSESESESVQQKDTPPVTTSSAAPKKPFQKLLDRGKIVVNLPAASADADTTAEVEEPPSKRVKTTGGSRFSSLGSFLPPPKKTAASAPTAPAKKPGSAPPPGVHLRTAAEPAFVRGASNADATEYGDGDADTSSASPMNNPQPTSRGPSIPEGQKPEEEVKLVGKPLMFKPLSVARRKAPAKNKKQDSLAVSASTAPNVAVQNGPTPTTAQTAPAQQEPPPKKKVSLFSMGNDDDGSSSTSASAAPTGTYEPLFLASPNDGATADVEEEGGEEDAVTAAYPPYTQPQPPPTSQQHHHQQDTLSALADSLDLTPAARRELFGRGGRAHDDGFSSPFSSSSSSSAPPAAAAAGGLAAGNAKVVTFDMAREYAHNEALRASGAQQQAYNPVRSIAPGKHSLRQLVNAAQTNQSALEDSFARARGTKRDAAGRYGWK